MEKKFIVFYSPGTFVAEENTVPCASYDISEACKQAQNITQRYQAKPYGFRFITRSRSDNELGSKETDHSPMYYIDGKVESIEEIEAEHNPDRRILVSNMKINGWSHVVTTMSPYRWTQPLYAGDCVVDSKTHGVVFRMT